MNLLSIFQTNSGKFYRLFEEAADNNVAAAKELVAVCKNPKESAKIAKRIHKLEHKGDEISHLLYEELHRIFVPPIDREDIIALTRSLDDVVDLIYASAARIEIYNIKTVDKTTSQLAKIVHDSAVLVADALPHFRSRKGFSAVNKAGIEINKKENEADVLLKEGLHGLFMGKKDAKKIIAAKDIYEIMEQATNALEDIADVLQGLTTKYE